MMPDWLNWLAIASLSLSFLCALVIVVDLLAGHRQRMWIMNLVWPITALYSGPLGLWLYFGAGRATTADQPHRAHGESHDQMHSAKSKPFWLLAATGTTHCGSGCTLGDVCAEWLMFVYPWALFGQKIFGAWVVDYVFAFAFGIAFQYFTIVPMRNLSPTQGLAAAFKADSLSLTAWQIGMYGWMAIAMFVLFGPELEPTSPVFWFMMQIAMLAGFATSYPVTWWLLKRGIKEPM